MRRLLLFLPALLAMIVAAPTLGSGPAPKWVKVEDGAYFGAWVQQGAIVYVPAQARLRPPADDLVQSDVPGVLEVEGGFAIREMESPPSVAEVVEDNRRAFVYHMPGWSSSPSTMNLTELPAGWSIELDGTDRYLRGTLDRLDKLTVAPSGRLYCSADSFGRLEVRGLHGESHALPGVPSYVLGSTCGLAWSSDSTALYLAHPTGDGVEIWLAPLKSQGHVLDVVPQFDGFVGTTSAGVLAYRYGLALYEVTPAGTRTVLNLTPEDVPWAVSPDGHYVLWLDRVVSLTSLESGKVLNLKMPKDYELCLPSCWPGSTSSEIAAYACGRDPSDTLLLLYREESPEHFDLVGMVAPPAGQVCFDYAVDPIVVGPGVVSVVVTDRSAFCIGDAVNTETWLVYLSGTGGH